MFSLSSFFGRPKAFALHFSDTDMHLLELRGANHQATVTSCRRGEIPPGLIENGIILDQKALAELIQKTVTETQPKPPATKRVVAALPEAHAYSHHFSIPLETPKDDFQEEVLRQVQETMPLNLDEHAWDFQVLKKTDKVYEVLFSAAPADIAAAYEQTLLLAGLELTILEPESLSLMRALVRPPMLTEGAIVIVDMGGRATTFLFIDQTGLALSIMHPHGGNDLTQVIAKKNKITEKTAEEHKREKGLADKSAGAAIRDALKPMQEEFTKARAHYQKISGRTVTQVLVTGGSSKLTGIAEEFQASWGLPASIAAPPLSIKGADPARIITVSGLAMRASGLLPGINFIVAGS